jgi:hypothetical protein
MPNILDLHNVSTQPPLPSFSVWSAGVWFVMFFTLEASKSRTHYSPGLGRYHCAVADCPACAVGEKASEHTLIPSETSGSRTSR